MSTKKKKLDPTITENDGLQCTQQHNMADYESDSSDGEFAETNVLLGYASKDADEDTISRIGGRPVSYLLPHLYPSIPPY